MQRLRQSNGKLVRSVSGIQEPQVDQCRMPVRTTEDPMSETGVRLEERE